MLLRKLTATLEMVKGIIGMRMAQLRPMHRPRDARKGLGFADKAGKLARAAGAGTTAWI